MALIVGWLVARLDEQRRTAEQRAAEAEALRDELGRRADLLDAANRCARALSSSLDLDEAFGEFIRELRGLVPFDRMAIVLAESGAARVIATAGNRAGDVMPPGTVAAARTESARRSDRQRRRLCIGRTWPTLGTRRRSSSSRSVLRSRVVAPLLVGARSVGLISRRAREPYAFERARARARLAARPARRIRDPEHPGVRERAPDCRGAAPALGASRRLRLARLARAAQPDGDRDRRRPHAADSAGVSCSPSNARRSWR